MPAPRWAPTVRRQMPTLCWLDASDSSLDVQCAVGCIAAVLLVLGVMPLAMIVVMWVLYLSLSIAGQSYIN